MKDDDTAGEILADEFPDRPDLVLVDGGLGQLTIAREVLADLGITDITLIGVAKGPDRDAGREHFHIPGRERPMMLEPDASDDRRCREEDPEAGGRQLEARRQLRRGHRQRYERKKAASIARRSESVS